MKNDHFQDYRRTLLKKSIMVLLDYKKILFIYKYEENVKTIK